MVEELAALQRKMNSLQVMLYGVSKKASLCTWLQLLPPCSSFPEFSQAYDVV